MFNHAFDLIQCLARKGKLSNIVVGGSGLVKNKGRTAYLLAPMRTLDPVLGVLESPPRLVDGLQELVVPPVRAIEEPEAREEGLQRAIILLPQVVEKPEAEGVVINSGSTLL